MLFADGPYINESASFLKYDALILVKASNSITAFIAILRELCDCCEANEG
uniref:Uncharacterized protein n=1 Tax=Physcomitrium patens TaxID=3218 RepID=A0A2K1K049_PHYPA|nr:hypothetical protein PHYPA_014270 [Physcomitrium patens]